VEFKLVLALIRPVDRDADPLFTLLSDEPDVDPLLNLLSDELDRKLTFCKLADKLDVELCEVLLIVVSRTLGFSTSTLVLLTIFEDEDTDDVDVYGILLVGFGVIFFSFSTIVFIADLTCGQFFFLCKSQ